MLHRLSAECVEIRGGPMREDVDAIKGPGQKIIVPIITKTDLDNLQ